MARKREVRPPPPPQLRRVGQITSKQMGASWYTGCVCMLLAWSAKVLTPLQIVPDDNSCLFSSIALIFEQTISKAQDIRKSEPPV